MHRRSSRSRTSARLTAAALVLSLLCLDVTGATGPAPLCQASLTLLRINDQDPVQALAPDGFISDARLTVDATVQAQGPDCDAPRNHPPRLLGAWLSSDLTSPTGDFTCRVSYVGADGDAPASITAQLDRAPP